MLRGDWRDAVSLVSIVGAFNTRFGAFVRKDRETGVLHDLKSIYELVIEAGHGALLGSTSEAPASRAASPS
jgi:acetyl-CoA C-acetyltransferase